MSQNYPNPFNPTTTIRYALPEKSHVTLTIYNIAGQVVDVLENKTKEAGYYSVQWDVPQGGIGSGVYFYRIQVNDPANGGAGDFQQVRKCLLIK